MLSIIRRHLYQIETKAHGDYSVFLGHLYNDADGTEIIIENQNVLRLT